MVVAGTLYTNILSCVLYGTVYFHKEEHSFELNNQTTIYQAPCTTPPDFNSGTSTMPKWSPPKFVFGVFFVSWRGCILRVDGRFTDGYNWCFIQRRTLISIFTGVHFDFKHLCLDKLEEGSDISYYIRSTNARRLCCIIACSSCCARKS